MALTFTERVDSRPGEDGDNPWRELVYDLRGTSSDTTARAAAAVSAPETYDDLPRGSIKLDPVWVDTTTGNGHWVVTVRYGADSPIEAGDSVVSFETGGGTEHITQSRETISATAAAGTAPDYKGAIGVTDDSVEGVDVTVPVYNWSETHYLAADTVDQAYRIAVANLTGMYNDAEFRGFPAGEVQFMGATGTKRDEEKWEITFRFAQSPNRTDIDIGGVITVPTKLGWHYLWVRYADTEDDTAKRIVKRPVAAYVERVSEAGDFGNLGI